MLPHGHATAAKMHNPAEVFWRSRLFREIQEQPENCPSRRAEDETLKTQIPSTETNRLELLPERNQENQLDFAGPIELKTRGYDVF